MSSKSSLFDVSQLKNPINVHILFTVDNVYLEQECINLNCRDEHRSVSLDEHRPLVLDEHRYFST